MKDINEGSRTCKGFSGLIRTWLTLSVWPLRILVCSPVVTLNILMAEPEGEKKYLCAKKRYCELIVLGLGPGRATEPFKEEI